jgi:tryptophan synthase alpha chain
VIDRDGRCRLIAYLTCGEPSLEATVEVALELERAGASALELGIPFSDPIADGPVIQEASQRALSRGTTVAGVLDAAREIRAQSGIPLIAFSYLNPVLRFGIERFALAARESGFDAVLITDLPAEDAAEAKSIIRREGLHLIFLLAPTSSPHRVAMVDRMSTSFIYYVSTAGVTGDRRDLDPLLLERLRTLRPQLRRPLAVGFGISTPEHYRLLAPHCDAVVVGSAIMRAIAAPGGEGVAGRAGEVVRSMLRGPGV